MTAEEIAQRDERPAVAIPFGTSPAIPRTEWKALEANANLQDVPKAYDGPRETRWGTSTKNPVTGANDTPLPRYFTLDLGKSWTIDRMTIDCDYQGIGEYKVSMSDDPANLGTPVLASIMSNTRPSSFSFTPSLTGRYFKIEIVKPFYTKEPPPSYAYISELTLEGTEATNGAHAKRCEGEPLTINWEYPADAELLIDKFQLWYRSEPQGQVLAKVDIDKSKRTVTFPVKFNSAPYAYYSAIVTGKNSVGVIWESTESNQLCIGYDPNRPWCMDKPQPPPVIVLGAEAWPSRAEN